MQHIAVAMSGGVDSSVCAALLVEKGYKVIGVTMQVPGAGKEEGAGFSPVEDARKVCGLLHIPHFTIDLEEEFTERVVRYFIDEYMAGHTPNPCVVCNRYIKMGALLGRVLDLGADHMATGHYARVHYDATFDRYAMCRPEDKKKDQTYFLYALTQDQLRHLLFPLGGYSKEEVRELAAYYNLPVAKKKESQEICFTGADYRSFIAAHAGRHISPGPFLDQSGKVLGQHRGLPYYTVGQRRGLGVAGGERLYVTGFDMESNAVILGPENKVWGDRLKVEELNFVSFPAPEEPSLAQVQVRYHSRPVQALISPLAHNSYAVLCAEPVFAITPGQSVVFYRDDCLWGGGVIAEEMG